MNPTVTAVDANHPRPKWNRPTEAGGGEKARPQGRFSLACGARPLDGYTIKRGVGHGGFGDVYYAVSDGGKDVALKLIRRSLDVELRGIRQCLNLKHPNLLSIFDIRTDAEGNNWVIMEYVAGESLEDVLAAHPDGLPPEDALAWFRGIAAGVAYLHEHGIVHRDLKPGNIFADEGVVKLGDYGLSKFIACSRRSGQTESVGTVHYMAPEISKGAYGKEIDTYALGIILYEMLTGNVPFEGESVGEILMKHLTAVPDLSRVPQAYRPVIAKALEKDPQKRFSSVEEMLAALPGGAGAAGYVGLVHTAGTEANDSPADGRAGNATGEDYILAEAVENPSHSDDPLWRGISEAWGRLRESWNNSNLSTPLRALIIVGVLVALIAHADVLVPVFLTLLFIYAVYRLVLALAGPQQASTAQRTVPQSPFAQSPAAGGHPPPHRPREQHPRRHRPPSWMRRREEAATVFPLKSPREQMADLLGSLLGSSLVAGVMCVVLAMVAGFRATMPDYRQMAWLWVVSTLAAWCVLAFSKMWENREGDIVLRRFTFMVLGMGIGAAAYLLGNYLGAELFYDNRFSTPQTWQLPPSFYADGVPQLPAFAAVFGTLFLFIRWWRLADIRRASRLSLFSLIVCTGVAWLAAALWMFPAQWMMMAAATICIAVQLASPMLTAREREALGES